MKAKVENVKILARDFSSADECGRFALTFTTFDSDFIFGNEFNINHDYIFMVECMPIMLEGDVSVMPQEIRQEKIRNFLEILTEDELFGIVKYWWVQITDFDMGEEWGYQEPREKFNNLEELAKYCHDYVTDNWDYLHDHELEHYGLK